MMPAAHISDPSQSLQEYLGAISSISVSHRRRFSTRFAISGYGDCGFISTVALAFASTFGTLGCALATAAAGSAHIVLANNQTTTVLAALFALVVLTHIRPCTLLATRLLLAVLADSRPCSLLAVVLILAVLAHIRPSTLLAAILLLAMLADS